MAILAKFKGKKVIFGNLKVLKGHFEGKNVYAQHCNNKLKLKEIEILFTIH